MLMMYNSFTYIHSNTNYRVAFKCKPYIKN